MWTHIWQIFLFHGETKWDSDYDIFCHRFWLCVVLSVKCLRGLTVRLNFMLKFSLIVSRTKMLYKLDLNPILRKKKVFVYFLVSYNIFLFVYLVFEKDKLCATSLKQVLLTLLFLEGMIFLRSHSYGLDLPHTSELTCSFRTEIFIPSHSPPSSPVLTSGPALSVHKLTDLLWGFLFFHDM